MNLEAKASAGYAMAALLVAMAVMAIVLSAAMPTWSQMIQRDKEAELVFRGEQYARAINQYQRKFANASPASLDVLIEQRMLRKKFRDPLSPNKDGEFQMLYLQNQSTMGPQGTGRGQAQGQGQGQAQGQEQGQASRGAGPGTGGSIGPSPSGRGAIVGVASKNTGQSIRLYKGKNRYNEWQFIGMEMSTQAGGGVAAGGRGGAQRGGRDGRGGTGRESGFSGPDGRGGMGGGGSRGRGDQGGFGGRRGSITAALTSRRRAAPAEAAESRCSRAMDSRDWSETPRTLRAPDQSITSSP